MLKIYELNVDAKKVNFMKSQIIPFIVIGINMMSKT